MGEIPRGYVPLLSSHPITHENTSPTHKPRGQLCVQRWGDPPDGVFTGGEDLAIELEIETPGKNKPLKQPSVASLPF